MRTSRQTIATALSSRGAISQSLEILALSALAQSGVGPGADPRRIAVGLGFRVRAMTRAPGRAEVHDGDCICYQWSPDACEMGLNVFVGLAMALLRAEHDTGDVYRLAGYLALPSETSRDDGDQVHCPAWFVAARRGRGWIGPGLRLCPAG